MRADRKNSAQAVAAFVVISVAVVGFFTGLQSPMKEPQTEPKLKVVAGDVRPEDLQSIVTAQSGVIPATHYTRMPEVMQALRGRTLLPGLTPPVDSLEKIRIEPEEKQLALQRRNENRAYNGAPPTVPHPIDQISDASCIVCHGVGLKTESLRIPRLSHQFLTNCTQCHVEKTAQHLESEVFRGNNFVGVDAPQEGPRAFPGAPPQIPHAIWMRVDCMSCHGYSGLHGIRTTHPWRKNCQQCHTPAAAMDQTFLADQPVFLPGPIVEQFAEENDDVNQENPPEPKDADDE